MIVSAIKDITKLRSKNTNLKILILIWQFLRKYRFRRGYTAPVGCINNF
jgi:hypothetical protein